MADKAPYKLVVKLDGARPEKIAEALAQLRETAADYDQTGDAHRAQRIADAYNAIQMRLDDVMRDGDPEHNRNVALLERAERAEALTQEMAALRDRDIAEALTRHDAQQAKLDQAYIRIGELEAHLAALRAALTTIGDWRLNEAIKQFSRFVAMLPEDERALAERYSGWLLMARELIDAALAASADQSLLAGRRDGAV